MNRLTTMLLAGAFAVSLGACNKAEDPAETQADVAEAQSEAQSDVAEAQADANQEMMQAYIGKPLTRVPDPFSNEYPSFGAANNARLRAFLDGFGFEYEFASATDYYTSGRFDKALLRMLEVYDEVMEIILPTLGPDRRATYSPFLPISPTTGIVLQVPMVDRNVEVDDDARGLVAARALGPAKARILLALLIAHGITDPAAIQAEFDRR